jgi:hypothetical protein
MRPATRQRPSRWLSLSHTASLSLLIVAPALSLGAQSIAQNPCASVAADRPADVYIPIDSWVYPAMDRLHGLGYLDTAFLGLRPWTRRDIARMIDAASKEAGLADNQPALEILATLKRQFPAIIDRPNHLSLACESAYLRVQGISGLPLRDSFNLGQTITNDYGRPYQHGFNTIDGASASAQYGRFALFFRGEYQHAPSAAGYAPPLVAALDILDGVTNPNVPPPATIPAGPIPAANPFRIVEANLSCRLIGHVLSFGKSDHWFAPTVGGAFTYSNNAENIYAFQIDRTEPLYVPLLSRLTGPFRYDFFVGSLKGHTDPNHPWIHAEKINFKPTANVELGFERSVIWGGAGHVPITVGSFLRSFFSFQNVPVAQKHSTHDPGARFGSFDFSWRLPWLSHWVTLYTDSLVHDDVSPTDAPRHAGVRPGIFLSRLPGLQRLDLRVEGVSTDPPTARSIDGDYLYVEAVQVQGYTNKGFILGDAAGREAKGGQGWLTYHRSPTDLVQASFRNLKVATDFVPGGTTQNSLALRAVKHLHRGLHVSANFQHEWWKAPIYQDGPRSDSSATLQLEWQPTTAVTPGTASFK